MKKIILFSVLCACVLLPLSAQKKWHYELGLAGTLNSGNVENMGIRSNGAIERNDSVLAFDAHCKYLFGEEKRKMNNREFSGGIKFDVFQYGKFSPFFAAEYLTNYFKGYDHKLSLLVGAKYRIYAKPKVCDYSFSAAYVCDFVDYHVPTTLNNQVSRLSLRIKIKQKISDVISIKHTTFYQPSLASASDFAEDYIVTSTTRIENKIGHNLYLDLVFDYEHRNLVPENTKRDDIFTEVALRLKF